MLAVLSVTGKEKRKSLDCFPTSHSFARLFIFLVVSVQSLEVKYLVIQGKEGDILDI